MIKVQGFKKQMPGFVLEADFEVQSGERLALTGRSGCGKTTLLRWICGVDSLQPSDQGELLSDGIRLSDLPAHQRNLGVVFQDAGLLSELNVWENAAFGLRMRGFAPAERRAAVMPWLERLGLLPIANQPVAGLSGGERQRVAFVRAVVWKPKALLLDEPFSALDHSLREKLRSDLIQLHQEYPVPMIVVTHDREDVARIATRELICKESGDGSFRKF